MLGLDPKVVNARSRLDVGPNPDAGPKPDVVNAGREPELGPKPNAVNVGSEPDVGPKPNAVNVELKPDAVNAGLKPDVVNAGPKPDAINAGPKPDAWPKPKSRAEAQKCKCRAEARCGAKAQYSKCRAEAQCCLLVGDFLQWKKETMKEHELFAIPMQEFWVANWPSRRRASTSRDMHRYTQEMCRRCVHVVDRPSGHGSSCLGGRVKTAGGLPAIVGTTRLSCGMGGRDGLGLLSQRISLWRSKDRGWSTC
ncbi:hypothetical protein CRG98_021527 [Punica granatum]|uniref:Uncharacterized protein n=1 Tax=Punica granatum TaxID=22663 RepID=A0A2I0JQC3_PUNGR|nr:hypothetical protein CRG98_021527 [Punica granatum]